MAPPVEQPVSLPKPAGRTAHKKASREEGVEDFQTALRSADQNKPKPPAKEEQKAEAAGKPALAKQARKASGPQKQDDAPVQMDEGVVAADQQVPVLADDAPPAVDDGAVLENIEIIPAYTEQEAIPAAPIPETIAAIIPAVPPADLQSTDEAEPTTEGEVIESDLSIPEPTARKTEPQSADIKPAPAKPSITFDESLYVVNADIEPDNKPGETTSTHDLSAIPVDAAGLEENTEALKELPPPVARPALIEPQPAITQSAGFIENSRTVSTAPVVTAHAPEAQFAEANHAKIVTAVRGQLLPDGGEMRIRLDPPELGALWVRVQVQNGVVNASFETSNEQATRVLSHSLTQLKHVLETQGIAVDKLQVTQAPREQSGPGGQFQDQREHQQQGGQELGGRSSQRDQQRQDLIQKMWEKIALGREPLDMKG